jgi:hypothetical protein
MNSSTSVFYWTLPGSSYQDVKYTYILGNGTPGSTISTFDVEGPPAVAPNISEGQLVLGPVVKAPFTFIFAQPAAADNNRSGIVITEPPTGLPQDYIGKFSWIQILNKYTVDLFYSAGVEMPNFGFVPGELDNTYPYRCGNGMDLPFAACGFTANDSPGLTPDCNHQYTSMGWDFQATMYLMWQATTTVPGGTPVYGAIPIPLGNINWGFTGTALRTGGIWSAPSTMLQPLKLSFQVPAPYPNWNNVGANSPPKSCQ